MATSQDIKTPQNPSYITPTPGKITVVAFKPNVGNAAMSESLCSNLKDCGFNSALVETKEANVSSSLTNCSKYGIKPFLRSDDLKENASKWFNFVKAYMDNPNLGGWFLCSGVTSSQAEKDSALYNCVNNIRKKDKTQSVNGEKISHPIFIGAREALDVTQASNQSYKSYIENIEYNLQPSFWPVIPFRRQHYQTFPSSSFYRELEIFALLARYTNSPMWAYMQCLYEQQGEDNFPPNVALRLKSAVFSALAYGAQGIVWYPYHSTKIDSVTYNALVNNNQEPTPLWSFIKSINAQISNYSLIFNGSALVQCRHTGTTQYSGTCKLNGGFGPLKSLTSGSDGVLVSHLCTNGADYLVIVNHPGAARQTLTLEFSSYWNVSEILLSGNLLSMSPVTQTTISVTLNAGGIQIYHWD